MRSYHKDQLSAYRSLGDKFSRKNPPTEGEFRSISVCATERQRIYRAEVSTFFMKYTQKFYR